MPSALRLPLLLLLAPMMLTGQSPELVQAKARVVALNADLEKLDAVIDRELEGALAKEVDLRPKGEFETSAEYQVRRAAAEEAKQRLAPEYQRKKADRRRAIGDEIEGLTSRPYAAPIRIRLGTYDADSETFPFFVRATGDRGTIEIPRAVAKEIKTILPTLKQTGWWGLFAHGTSQLAVVAIYHKMEKHVSLLIRQAKSTVTLSDGLFYKARILTSLTERVRLTPPVRLTLMVRDNVVIQAVTNGQQSRTFNFSVAEARIWTVQEDLVLRTTAIELLRGDLNGIPINIGEGTGPGVILISPDGMYKVTTYAPLEISDEFLAAIRSGAGGAVAAKGPSLPPALSAAVSFSEPSGDKVLAADEAGGLAVTLTNSGQGAAYGVEVDITGVAPGLSFPSVRYVGEIAPGKSQQVSLPLKAGLGLPTGRVTLTVIFSEANGFEPDPVAITFETRAFAPPELAVADVGVDEPSGDGMIEAGEVVTVLVRVQNRGQGTAEEVQARVNIGNNVFAAAGSATEFDLGTLPSGAYRDIDFQIYTNRRAKAIPVTMTLTERHGKYGLDGAPLELPFNQPVRTIQQVVIAGTETALPEVDDAGGLSIDIEGDIPQGRDQRTDAVALIIANRDYQNPDIPAVTFAHRDGEFMRQYLIQTLGYREGNIFVYRDATQSNFRTALRKLRNAAKKKADVFVYYTGHGAPDPEEKRGYFVPVDCDPNYVQLGGVGLDEFYDALRDIPARTMTVVIDACFSGASDQGMIVRNISPIMLVVESEARLGDRAVAFTSSAGQEVSSWYPEKKHSLYTYFFLKGLQGAADQDQDQALTAGELQDYLEGNVPYMARRLNNRQQTPEMTPGRENWVLVRYKR